MLGFYVFLSERNVKSLVQDGRCICDFSFISSYRKSYLTLTQRKRHIYNYATSTESISKALSVIWNESATYVHISR